MNTSLFDRAPRVLSLLGLFGLIGIVGVYDPGWWHFSALSFLSYLCYFRFLRWIVKPPPEVNSGGLLVWLLGFIAGTFPMMIAPWMFEVSPMFGFIGFAGYLGLYEPSGQAREKPTA
jgi:hypothetical protein